MITDPIVEEVRAVRDEIARENQYDVDAIFATLRKAEAESSTHHITLPPQKVDMTPLRAKSV